jgi:dTDP-4-dehydrorhamnose reductase
LRGIFHLSGGGETNWADFAREIFAGLAARGGKRMTVESIGTADYPTPARRPANSRLSCAKLADCYGIRLPNWQESLSACLDRLVGAEGKGES